MHSLPGQVALARISREFRAERGKERRERDIIEESERQRERDRESEVAGREELSVEQVFVQRLLAYTIYTLLEDSLRGTF